MFMTEEELTVEIAQIYRIEIDYVYFTEAAEDEVFEKFAADATCPNN